MFPKPPFSEPSPLVNAQIQVIEIKSKASTSSSAKLNFRIFLARIRAQRCFVDSEFALMSDFVSKQNNDGQVVQKIYLMAIAISASLLLLLLLQ